MRYWKVTFEWKTRPLYRKGRLKTCAVTFAAESQTQAYELAQKDGGNRFPRHKWKVVGCEEIIVMEKESHVQYEG